MKDVLALVLSFSMVSAPVFAQDDRSEPTEEAEEDPEPTSVVEADAASEKNVDTTADRADEKTELT